MIGWLAPAFGIAGFACWMLAITLLVYLSLRNDALRRSGGLPASTPEIFVLGSGPWGAGMNLDIALLYTRQYREMDGQTRRLVPLIRVLLPLTPVLILLAFVVGRFGT